MAKPAPRVLYRSWVLRALRAIGPATPRQVYAWIRKNEPVPLADLAGVTVDGENLFEKTVRWARKDLFDQGVVKSPKRGIWSL